MIIKFVLSQVVDYALKYTLLHTHISHRFPSTFGVICLSFVEEILIDFLLSENSDRLSHTKYGKDSV